MKSNLRKALALLLTLIMVMTSLPTSALAEMVTDLAKSVTDVSEGKQLFGDAFVSPLSIVDEDTNFITYTFENEDGTKIDEQIVKNGDTLYAPASPEKEGHKFVGWYNGNTKFDTFGEQTGIDATSSVTLTAKFEEVHYVFFMDNNSRVVQTKEGVKDDVITVDDVTFAVGTDEGITGWYTDSASTNRVDFVTLADANITLYSKVEKGHWITFDSVDGTYVKPAFYLPGEKTVQPENVTKPGYTLVGWYKDNASFAFGTSLQKNVTLKAQWKANTDTKYTVIHWWENANNNEYSYHESETKYGTTDEQTAATGKTYSVTDKDLLGKNTTLDNVFTAQSIEQQTIKGDGSTIVNVYYSRAKYTLSFGYYSYSYYGRVWNEITKVEKKYGQDIAASEWPKNGNQANWKIDKSERYIAYQSTMPLNGGQLLRQNDSGKENTATYYVETLNGNEDEAIQLNGRWFKVHHEDKTKDTATNTVGEEDRYPLTGFENIPSMGTQPDHSYQNAKFYYSRNNYHVVYYNGDTVEYQKDYKYEADISGAGKVYTPTTPPAGKKGFNFEGWYADPKGTMAYAFEGKTMPAENIIVYAKWVPPTVSGVAFKVMTGGDDKKTLTVEYGQTINPNDMPEPVYPDGDGWDFVCWATKEKGNFIPFNFNTKIYANIELYPYFVNTKALTVTYVVNGGTGKVIDNKTYAVNAHADVLYAKDVTAPQGKVFLGWNTQDDGKGTMYQPGDKVKMEDNVTLYAIWGDQAATTSITYHANFDNDATYTDSNIKNNASVPVKSYVDTRLASRQGYTFQGWSTNRDATEPNVGETIRVDSKNASAENNLYAVWTANTNTKYTVEYYFENLDDENFTKDEDKTQYLTGVTDATANVPNPIPTFPGFTFDDDNRENVLSGTIAGDESLVLKLYYTRNTYTVIYDKGHHGTLSGDGVDTTTGNKTVPDLKYGAPMPAAPTVTVDEGYQFVDWGVSEIPTIVTGDATYTAQYAEIDGVVIHYEVDNANAGSVDPISETLKAVTGTASGSVAIANAGWVFTGWTLKDSQVVLTTENKLEPKKGDVAGSTVWTERTYVAHFTRKTAQLTIQKVWADGAYTDNRVPVTLTIYRKIDNGAGEPWKSIALDESKKLSTNASIWQATESAETHDATNHPYTYYIESEVATVTANQDKLKTYYTFAPGSGVALTENGTNTLTGTNTLATKELTIAKTIANAPQSYMNETFKFEVKKSDGSTVTLLQKNDDGTTTEINEIRLGDRGSIILILPIDTYTVSEVFEGEQENVWQAQNPVTVNLANDENRAEFTNSLQTDTITVEKKWLDEEGTHSAVRVTVAGMNGYTETRDVTSGTPTTFTVPKADKDGAAATYRVTEGTVTGYETYYKVNGGEASLDAATGVHSDDTVTIYNVKTGTITIQKKWDNYSKEDIKNIYSVKGTLSTKVLGKEWSEEFEITSANDWTIELTVPLYTYDENGAIDRTLLEPEEKHVYQKDINGARGEDIFGSFEWTSYYVDESYNGLIISNTYNGKENFREFSLEKAWVRPEYMATDETVEAKFTLYKYIGSENAEDDLDVAEKWEEIVGYNTTLHEPGEEGNWTSLNNGTEKATNGGWFAPLPKYDENGNEIIYAMKETYVKAGYYELPEQAMVLAGTSNKFSFTNTMAESATLTIEKTAYDVDGKKLETGTFTFEIMRVGGDANHSVTKTIDLSEGSSKKVKLVPGTYTVTETHAGAWDTTYTVTDTEADGTTMTREPVEGKSARVTTDGTVHFENTRKSVGEFTVYKKWEDSASQITVRPRPVQYESWLELWYKRNETDARWQEYDGATLNVTTTEGNPLYTITYSGMPEKDTDGTAFIYAVKETIPADKNYYTLTVDGDHKVTGTDDAVLVTDGGTMTNTLSLGSLTIEKNIEDASEENYSVDFDFTVKLNGVGNGVPATVTVASTTKNGNYTVSDLPVGSYTVKETLVAGWSVDEATKSASVTTNGGSVTFKNTRQLYPLTVTKQWVDGENKPLEAKNQPDSLMVTIMRSTDTQQIETRVTLYKTDYLPNTGNWVEKLQDLPRFAPDGTPYTYTVSESLSNDYQLMNTPVVTFDDNDGKYTVTLTNAKTAESPTDPTKELDENTKNKVLISNAATGNVKMAQVGDKLTYTITYKNHLATAQKITITDKLPAGLKLADGNKYDWQWDSDKGTATLVLDNVPAFKEDSMTITVEVTAEALNGDSNPMVQNTATVTIGDVTQTATSDETPVYNPYFTVTKTVVGKGANHEYAEGETVEFEITVENTGNVILENIDVTDKLDGKEVLKLKDDQGNLADKQTITSLKPEKKKTFTVEYVVEYDDLGGQTITNTATAKYGETAKSAEAKFKTEAYTQFTVTKVWNDNGDEFGVRPDSVTVQLNRDGAFYREAELKPDENGNWPSHTFKNLPQHKADGSTLSEYEVVETEIGNVTVVKGQAADYDVSYFDVTETTLDSGVTTFSQTITNTLDVSANTVSIEKVWNDESDEYGLRPTTDVFKSWVQLQRKDGENWDEYTGNAEYPVSKAVSDDYTVTFTGMPMYDANGNKYQYRIVEVNVPAYYYNGVSTDTALVNRLETRTVVVGKTLVDASRDESATQTFKFYVTRADGEKIASFGGNGFAKFEEDSDGNCFFEITAKNGETTQVQLKLPVGTYTITEETNAAWTTMVEKAKTAKAEVTVSKEDAEVPRMVTFTNTRNLYNNDGKIKVTKNWVRIGTEAYPDVTFELWQQLGDAEVLYQTLTLNGANVDADGKISGEFTNVPKFAPDGTEYVYDVTEEPVPGYDQTSRSPNTEKTEWTFTNERLKAGDIQITKKWEDDSDKFGLRPSADKFKDYVTLARKTEKETEWKLFNWDSEVNDLGGNRYSVKFSGMPQTDAAGEEYIYRVVEYKTMDKNSPVAYYNASSDNGEGYMTIKNATAPMYAWARNGETITNTLQTETLTIKKIVEGYVGDATGDDLIFSFTITPSDNKVKMDKMETPTITVKPTEKSAETYVTLPVGEYTVTENHNDAWTVSVRHTDPNVEPTVAPTDGTQTSNSSATLHTGNTVIFTNTRQLFNGDGKYTVVKNWNKYETEKFPNVTITLEGKYTDEQGEKVGWTDSVTLEGTKITSADGKSGTIEHTFTNVPAYDLDGNALTYTATESDVPGYTAQTPETTATSTTFTNTADGIELKVYKEWKNGDGTKYTGELPESLTVELWRKGEDKAYDSMTLTAADADENGRWYSTSNFDFPKYDVENGKDYEYYVHEVVPENLGFEPEANDLSTFVKNEESDDLYSVTLVNKKTGSTPKNPEKTVKADFKTVQITDETTGKMVEDGAQLTYNITYFNHFSDPKTIVITDTLDPNVSFDPADNPGVTSYDEGSRTVRWEIPDVQPGTGNKVELTVRVALTDEAKASADPTIPNTATVNIGNDATQTAESEKVTVYNPRLTVEKITANVPAKGYYALGETAEFEITASNIGNVLLENIVITEQLEGAQFVQSGDYTVEDGKAIIAALNPGQSVVVRAQYTVKYDDLYAEDDQQQAPMKNIVTATAQSGDDPVDGGDESEFKPDQLTHLTVEKHWADDLAVQRGEIRVQLTADGESYTADSRYDHEVILSYENNLSPADENVWVMEFDNLPKHNADGSEIRYSAVETYVDGHGTVTDGRCDGYDVTVADDPAAHTTVITNTAQRKKFTVLKVWKDGEGNLAESLIPDTELTVALFVDGFDMNDDDFRTTLTRANGWEGKIDRMFAYNQAGVAYEYTPMEMDANGNAIADGGSIVIDGVTYDVSITTQTEPDANRAEAHRDVTVIVTNTRRSDDPEENKPTKEANLAPGKTTVSVGDSLTYTISYHNSRNVKADVTITDVLADSLNFGSASHGGTYDPATRTVTWVLRDVAAFASDAVTLTVTVNEKAKQADDAAVVKNTATVVIPGNEADIRYDTNTVEIPVEPEKGVKPTKKAVGIDPAKDTVEIGQKVEYRIGYRNHKNTAVSVRIVDKLDDGVKFISASDGGVYDAAKHTVFWNIAKLAPFADGEVTLTVEVTEAARKLADGETMATVNNTATVKFDKDPETETNVVDIPVKPNDPKKPEKKAEGLNATDTKKVGDEIVYTITYVNNLNKKAKVVVTDALDEGVDFVEADNGGVYDKASHTVTWTFDSVDPFEGGTVKLTVKVNEKARQIKEGETTATVDNTAAVTVDNKTTTTSDPVEIPVTPDKPTDPTKKADDKALNSFGKIAVGDQLPFTVSYVNNLNTVATVTVRDTLEEGLTFVSADNGGTYDEATRTVTWVLKDVAPFTSGSVTVITEVNENAVDAADPTVANSAVVKIGDQPEQTTEPAEVTVYNPDFSVETKLTNLPAKGYFTAGETAAFDITVKNTGNVPLENVAVEELLDGVTFVQGEGYTIDGRIATIAALPIGEQIVLKAEYTVIEADLGNTDLANRITVRGETPENPDDPDQPHNPEDKGDEEPIPVDECVEITGTKTWNDADNAYGARPDVILVMLLANGEEKIGTRASAETEWKYTFIQQPKHDADGNEVVYSIREEEVPGYDTTYSAEGYDITNTLRRHTLTIRYWVDEVGGEQAFKTFTRDYYYGERYNVVSPAMDGYRADHEVVSGRIEGDLEVDVVYTAILWRLNIRYRRVGDGKTLAPMYTNGNVIIGDAYEVESPVIPGYTADRLVVKGEMHGRNMSFTVWYTPEQTEVVIVDEKTPFGLGNVVMNAGDCFE